MTSIHPAGRLDKREKGVICCKSLNTHPLQASIWIFKTRIEIYKHKNAFPTNELSPSHPRTLKGQQQSELFFWHVMNKKGLWALNGLWPAAKTESSALVFPQCSSNRPVEINVITALCSPQWYHFFLLLFTPSASQATIRISFGRIYIHSGFMLMLKSNYYFKVPSAKESYTRCPCQTAEDSYPACAADI